MGDLNLEDFHVVLCDCDVYVILLHEKCRY